MINPNLYINKVFREQVDNVWIICLVQSHNLVLKHTVSKNKTSVLALWMFHDTIGLKTNKYFRALICVIYIITDNCACIDYLGCQ